MLDIDAAPGAVVELISELVEIVVGVYDQLRAAESAPIDDRGVVQFVGEHGDVRATENRENRGISRKTCCKHQRAVGSFPLGEIAFKVGMRWPGSDNEPGCGRAGSPLLCCSARSGDDVGVR